MMGLRQGGTTMSVGQGRLGGQTAGAWMSGPRRWDLPWAGLAFGLECPAVYPLHQTVPLCVITSYSIHYTKLYEGADEAQVHQHDAGHQQADGADAGHRQGQGGHDVAEGGQQGVGLQQGDVQTALVALAHQPLQPLGQRGERLTIPGLDT